MSWLRCAKVQRLKSSASEHVADETAGDRSLPVEWHARPRKRFVKANQPRVQAGSDDRRRAMEAGFRHHLTKPVDPGMLNELLAEIARSHAVSAG